MSMDYIFLTDSGHLRSLRKKQFNPNAHSSSSPIVAMTFLPNQRVPTYKTDYHFHLKTSRHKYIRISLQFRLCNQIPCLFCLKDYSPTGPHCPCFFFNYQDSIENNQYYLYIYKCSKQKQSELLYKYYRNYKSLVLIMRIPHINTFHLKFQ